MNIVLGIISIIFVYTSTILMDKFLKKEGLIVWITFATITANILVCKNIDIFNLTVSLGNIMFASNFLATDILSEKYSKDYAYKAVIIGLVMNLLLSNRLLTGCSYNLSLISSNKAMIISNLSSIILCHLCYYSSWRL